MKINPEEMSEHGFTIPVTVSPASRNGNFGFSKHRVITLVASTLILFSLFLVYNTWQRQHDLLIHNQQLVAKSVTGAANEITLQIQELRRSITLFAESEKNLLLDIVNKNNAYEQYDQLTLKTQKIFPHAFGVTLADINGEPYVDDFNGVIEDVCRKDIKFFASHNHQPDVVIHPNPQAYHFDIMVPIELDKNTKTIFFVSFKPELISRFLETSQLFQNRLLILHRKYSGLIEIHSNGSREKLKDYEFHLSREEIKNINFRHDLEGTLWELVNLPNTNSLLNRTVPIWSSLIIFILAMIIVSGLLLQQIIKFNTRIVNQNESLARYAYGLRKHEEKMRLAQSIANMGYWNLNLATDELTLSENALHIFGIVDTGNRLIQNTILNAIPRTGLKKIRNAIASAIIRRKPRQFSFIVFRISDDEKRVLQASAELTTDIEGNPLHVFGIVQDITERRRSEVETQNALMEKVKAESANQSKSAFLANMSHEIRTPLNSIIGFAESLLDENHSDKQKGIITNTIIRNSYHLLQIINDILDLSKIEANKLDIEIKEFFLLDFLKEVEQLIKPHIHDKNLAFDIQYQFPLPEKITTDPLRLKQILINLCDNAIKFTTQGYINVQVSFDPKANHLVFMVRDSGIGMSPQQLNDVFRAFVQADSSTTRRYGGTGLGLALCKQLSEKLGGDISATCFPDIGCTFTARVSTGNESDVELIYEEDLEKLNNLPLASSGENNKRRFRGNILLAEDNIDNQKLIQFFVNRCGADLIIANDGKEAVKLAENFPIDLILMDMQMPVMDGVQATEVLRRQGFNNPIIALTANALVEDQEKCLNAGCNEFVTKPISKDKLMEIFIRYLPNDEIREEEIRNEHILSSLVENEPEYAKIVLEYVLSLDEMFSNILASYRKKNWHKLKNMVHDLKSSGGSYGFSMLTDLAKRIELCLDANKHEEISDLLDSLDVLCRQIQNGVQFYKTG